MLRLFRILRDLFRNSACKRALAPDFWL